ncbi:MAG: ABC transporter ATP-binding protein [Planctomycetota bacterium]
MIEVEALVKDYGGLRAVDRLSFEVAEGEIVGFLGPNGAGKTTTIRVLTGYHAATSGRAVVAGHDVFTDSLASRRLLSYLPENVPLYPDLRVEEYLRFRAALKGVPRRERRAAVALAMEQAGVVEVRRKLCNQVSRGYRQRVGLADALVSAPPILILDEPTSGLDPIQRGRIRTLVRSLAGRHTVLFSSHILSDVEEVCDRIVLIHEGVKRADGTLAELATQLGRREVRVEVAADGDRVRALFDGLDGLGAPELDAERGGFVLARGPLAPGVEAGPVLDALAARLRGGDLAFRQVHLHEPSLEEMFASLTSGARVEEDAA